jgi:hypothetical protein
VEGPFGRHDRGPQRKEFRFDVRYRVLTGTTRRGLAHQVEQGFLFLPSGSQIILDRQTQQLVLDNIRTQLTIRWSSLVGELRRRRPGQLSARVER